MKNDSELLSEAVSIIGMLYGALEVVQERLIKDDRGKWNSLKEGIELNLKIVDEFRKDF